MKRCFIFAAGTFYGLRECPQKEDFVIAADAGYRVCQQLGIVPDLLLGDFDSMEQPADFQNICRSPVEKDDTDTMLAVTSTAAPAESGWTIRWPICRRCGLFAAKVPEAISMAMISSGRLWRTRVFPLRKRWNGDCFLCSVWEIVRKVSMRLDSSTVWKTAC